jgi:D-alanyl-D-alanine carboxypeptidase
LLQHSAGVQDVSNDEEAVWNDMSYVRYKLTEDPNHQFSSEELVEQNVIHNFYYFSPGTDHHYSNTGYTILSEIIARVYSYRSGVSKTYGDYMRDYIYGESTPVPLSIHFPSRADDRELPLPFVCGTIYTNDQGKVVLSCKEDNMSAHVAEGNGYGTMRQINRYIRTLMKGEMDCTPQIGQNMLE